MNFNVLSPQTTEELLRLITENQNEKFRFGAGYTDLLVELKKQPHEGLTVINLAQLKDDLFTVIRECQDGMQIGSLTTANQIIANFTIKRNFPVLHSAASKLASCQIRQVATVGGNMCTASPAGDISNALVALNAKCEILNSSGKIRTVPIGKFFKGVRETDVGKDEVLRSILIPYNVTKAISSGFIKIGTRRSMECSVISLAYHIQVDSNNRITKAGVSIGSAAPTIKFTSSACEYLIGRDYSSIGKSEAEQFASIIIVYASPITDIRATAWYRREVLFNISKSIFEKTNEAGESPR